MIELARVGNNLLSLLIIVAVGYLIYNSLKTKKGVDTLGKIKKLLGGGIKK